MGFLLGAFGKLAAGRRVRDLQARMMRVQTKMRRATRQIESVSKMLETQKKMDLNSISFMSQMTKLSMPENVIGDLLKNPKFASLQGDSEFLAMLQSGVGTANLAGMSDVQKAALATYQNDITQLSGINEMNIAQMKSQIEEKYENLNDMMLEPLKMEEESLQTEKDSLESQIQIAQADYEACKKMEQADAKNLAPNYTGQA